MFHLGMIVAGLPYTCKLQKETKAVNGGTPYGATHIAATDGSRAVSEIERDCAKFQGRHIALLAKQMKAGKGANPQEPVKEVAAEAPAKKGKKAKKEGSKKKATKKGGSDKKAKTKKDKKKK
eukprot:TRINITY_DN83_c0_g1_i2.p1 TRINITY_DN83_c0_g1~~TRINITY_DN83_c0_g1_i2.p1  ORF type:complete len:122 (+),score=43.05 TRINITY_DN83_c0_g1_i2:68-433(+)